mmetsp:Transcript_64348/g.126339  ORF Transcript_64348/g.126339 Transcript_64348/m.126339 type:complete len:170 (+) Transcript_64348:122-631(+)
MAAGSAASREIWKDKAAASKTDVEVEEACWSEEETEYDEATGIVDLSVKVSTIPNAGDGLFLKTTWVPAGITLLQETAAVLKRPDAKRVLQDPVWSHANPVIQLNGNRFLDIRKLLLYKSNHAVASSRACNVSVEQVGPADLALVSSRPIRKGEELMWEYSPTWYPPGT